MLIGLTISLLSISAILIFFQKEIKNYFLTNIDQLLETEISIGDAKIQWFKSFPKITLSLENVRVKDASPVSSDSLLVLEKVVIGFNIKEFIAGQYQINYLALSNGKVHVKYDSLGNANYDIFKKSKKSGDLNLSLDFDEIELENVDITFHDDRSEQKYQFLAHQSQLAFEYGTEKLEIELEGNYLCRALKVGVNSFLESKPLKINTRFSFVFKSKKLIFEHSEIELENAKFAVDGHIQFLNNTDFDLKIISPETNVQSLISLLPHELSEDLKEYQSEGEMHFSALIKGKQTHSIQPNVTVDFGFSNASFFHPALQQKITQAYLNGKFTNGNKNSTPSSILKLNNFSCLIGQDKISGDMILENFDDPYLQMSLKGKFDVANALKVFPIKKIKKASGKIEADVQFKGKIKHLTDPKMAEQIKTGGKFKLENLNFDLDSVGVSFKDFMGMFYFDKHDLGISKLSGKVGKSDFEIKGFFKNFLAYVLLDHETLKIQAQFFSNYIDVDEILTKAMNESNHVAQNNKKVSYSFHLSPDLAYDLDLNVKKIEFRNLSGKDAGKNLSGKLLLRDQLLHYQNFKLSVANGEVEMNGVLNATDTGRIVLRNQTKIAHIDVKQAFFVMENFGQKFITDKNLDGLLTADVESFMTFDSKLHLDINSINSMAEVDIQNGSLNNFEPMQSMGTFLKKKSYAKHLKSSNFDRVKFSELKNTFYIHSSNIEIPEMVVQSDLAPDLTIKGNHSFDNKIDYHVSFPLINYQKTDDEEGLALDNKNRLNLFLYIHGTVDNYTIDLDKKKSFKSAVSAAGHKATELLKEDKPKVAPLDTEPVNPDDVIIEEW